MVRIQVPSHFSIPNELAAAPGTPGALLHIPVPQLWSAGLGMGGTRGSNLRLRGTIWWFRRRVPLALTGPLRLVEITRSLRTSCPREASRRARAAWLATERAFEAMARTPSLSEEQAAAIVRRLREEPLWTSPTAGEIMDRIGAGDWAQAELLFDHGSAAVQALPLSEQTHVIDHMTRLLDYVELVSSRQELNLERRRTALFELRALTAQMGELKAKEHARSALAVADRAALELTIEKRVADRVRAVAPVSAAASSVPSAATPDPLLASARPRKAKPLFSILEQGFLAEKTRVVDGHKGYDRQTVKQTEATLHLWVALVGDRPIDQYDGADAGRFREAMLRMPASHGKGGTRIAVRQAVPPIEAIRRADEKQKEIDARNALLPPDAEREPRVPRLSMKTLKRHFSTLSQYWLYARQRQYVPADSNPFTGWQYQGVGRGKRNKKRGPWSSEDLNRLLASDWFDGERAGRDEWWVTLIAMWGGLRVEEIARLRPSHDIQEFAGVPAFVLQDHPEPEVWSPKTEAGERVVPIHPVLLGLGIMDLVGQRRREGARRVFPSFRLRPSSDKLSAKFVSDFSRHKTALGVGKRTTFHSFRHNISTLLRNTPASDIRETWIDAVLGHAGGEDDAGRARQQSEGITTYLDTIGIRNLLATVEAIRYPDEMDLSRLRRPQGR